MVYGSEQVAPMALIEQKESPRRLPLRSLTYFS
jgi:hypothetical protein